jgi:hypothetical protein
MELFSLRKIHRICPQHHGPGRPAPANGSTDFIKRRPLVTGSMAKIKPIESLSRLLISVIHHRSDGWGSWLRPGAAPARAHAARRGRARWLARVRVFSSYGGRFSMSFAPTGSQRWGGRVYANLNRPRAATKLDKWEVARPMLIDGEGGLRWSFAPTTCTKASSSSLLASRPTNCSDRRWKTRIWWLPRVRRVLILRPKIHSICGAIYRGFR